MTELPQYRTLEPTFCAPDLIPSGSIIEFEGPPGPHLEPWNESARDAFAAWCDEEFDEIDPKTKDPTGKKIKPRAKYRPVAYVETPQQTARVIAGPEPTDGIGQTLAEMSLKKNTDQRPPAARRFKKESPVSAIAPSTEAPPPSAKVIEAGPASGTVKGGPG